MSIIAKPRATSAESTRPTMILGLGASIADVDGAERGVGEGTPPTLETGVVWQALSKKNTASGVSARAVLAFMRTAR